MAILGTLMVTAGLTYLGGKLFETEEPETPGYVIAVEEPAGETQTAEAGGEGAGGGGGGEASIATRLASADPEAGQGTARQCAACHNFQKGEGNKIGPTLWNVVDREVATVEGFNYTDAMTEFAKTEGTWTYEHLDTYLENPKGLVPGTAMNFSGIKKPDARADVIAYLHTLSDNPAPLPEAGAAPAAETEQPAAEGESQQSEEAQPASEQETASAETQPAQKQPAQEQQAAPAQEQAAPAQEQQQAAAEQPAQQQESQDSAPAASGGGEEDPELISMIAAADPAAGEKLTSQCKACHTFDQGGPNRIGPNLWGVVGRQVASHEGFKYTDAMQQYGQEIGGTWTYSHLSTYLENPRGQVPGTKMIFQGIKKKEDRAALLAYLRTLADSPAPLPGQ